MDVINRSSSAALVHFWNIGCPYGQQILVIPEPASQTNASFYLLNRTQFWVSCLYAAEDQQASFANAHDHDAIEISGVLMATPPASTASSAWWLSVDQC
jgi:hypothetical protein